MVSFLALLLSLSFGALPPTTLKGNSETLKPTTFNIEVPNYQATTSASVTRRIETGNWNQLLNPSFEATAGTTSHSFGTTASISTTNLVEGKKSVELALTSFSGTIASQAVLPTGSLAGLNLESSVYARATMGSIEVCGTSNSTVIQCTDVPAGNVWSSVVTNMPGVAGGTIGYLLRTKNNVAVTGTLGIDDTYVGRARNLAEVSQATQYGKVSTPGTTNCGWTNAAPTTSFASFSADADCPTATASGYASAPSTKIPAITFASLPPGKYYFVARLSGDYFAIDGASETDIGGAFRFTDGTNNFGGLNLRCIQASFCSASEFSGEIEYTSPQSNVTIQIQGRETLAAVTNLYINNGVTAVPTTFEISVYRYPTQNEIVARAENADTDWVSYTPTGSWVSNTTYTGKWRRQGDSMEIQAGWATSGAPTAANLTIDIPSGYTIDTAKLAAAAPSADTLSLGTAAMLDSGVAAYVGWANYSDTNSLIVVNTATGAAYGTIAGVGSTVPFSWGAGDSGSFIAKVPIVGWTNSKSAPLYVGSVTSNSSGLERSERLQFDGGSYQSNCTSSPCRIQNQSGAWVSSVVRNSTGNYTVNVASSIFTGDPTCTCSGNVGGGGFTNCQVTAYGATAVGLLMNDAAGSPIDSYVQVRCQGPR